MRDYAISYIRMIATISIVLCHIAQYLDIEMAYWLNLGVQVFLFVSGYLYGNKQIKKPIQWLIKNYLKVMIPFWIVIAVVVCCNMLFLHESIGVVGFIRNFIGLQGFATIPNMAHTWFITYILICYVMTPVLEKMKPFFSGKMYMFKLMAVCAVLMGIDYVVSLPVLCCYLACYIVGYYMASNAAFEKENKGILVWVILSAFFLVLRLLVQYHPSFVWKESFELLILNWNHTMVGISIFILLYSLLKKKNVKENMWLNLSDQYSYSIYLVHQIFIIGGFSLMRITNSVVLNILLVVICILVSAYALQFVSNVLLNALLRNNKGR